jgi:hypothetical protein
MAPQFVKPYVKSNKNDAVDAEAICEAVQRPNMRFVPEKSIEQQDIQSLHRIRSQLVARRTAQSKVSTNPPKSRVTLSATITMQSPSLFKEMFRVIPLRIWSAYALSQKSPIGNLAYKCKLLSNWYHYIGTWLVNGATLLNLRSTVVSQLFELGISSICQRSKS